MPTGAGNRGADDRGFISRAARSKSVATPARVIGQALRYNNTTAPREAISPVPSLYQPLSDSPSSALGRPRRGFTQDPLSYYSADAHTCKPHTGPVSGASPPWDRPSRCSRCPRGPPTPPSASWAFRRAAVHGGCGFGLDDGHQVTPPVACFNDPRIRRRTRSYRKQAVA